MVDEKRSVDRNHLKSNLLHYAVNLLLLVASINPSFAAPLIIEDQSLNFGALTVRANTSVSNFRVSATGTTNISGSLAYIGGALNGQYQLTGFPPNTTLKTELDNIPLFLNGVSGGEIYLSVTDYDVSDIQADSTGAAVIRLGASLKTSGTGETYPNGPYQGSTLMRITYWSAPSQSFQTFTENVTFKAELDSTLTLSNTNKLTFGKIAAFTSATESASMRLAPDSRVFLTRKGSARILNLGGASPAIFEVSSAAPDQGITISPQIGPSFLTHSVAGDSSARFIVDNFVTSPATRGTTNNSGILLIYLGATLNTEITDKPFTDGKYEGTYSLSVSY